MNKFLLILCALLLMSCVASSEKQSSQAQTSITYESTINHEYIEISEFRISWDEIFEMDSTNYYVYLFSRTCSHCSSIKNKIIEYALDNENMYFIEDNKDIVFKNDVNYTIGLKSVDDLAILGFPTILKISEKILVKNIAGTDKILSELKL